MAARGQETAAPAFFLKPGDRVVFYGDSITAQRLYTRLLEAMIATRYPGLQAQFYCAGVSGDTVHGGSKGDAPTRVSRDVAPLRPTVVTVMLGMNDGRYTTSNTDANLKTYADGYRTLLDLLKASSSPGVRFTLLRPSPYDEVSRPAPVSGYNDVLIRYGAFVNELAAENHTFSVDLNTAVTNVLTTAKKQNPILADELLPDHVHPSIWGHWVMASELAKTWGFDPVVSTVDVDAMRAALTSTHKAAVTQLTRTSTGLQWAQLDEALPLPLDLDDPITQFLLKISDLATMDRQIVRVTGLAAGNYVLSIDGDRVASFTASQLAAGVNLALYKTPMETQARTVDWDGAEPRAQLNATRLNLLAESPALAGANEAVAVLDAMDAQLREREHEHAQPKSHRFELTRE